LAARLQDMGDLLYRVVSRGLNNRQDERFATATGQESLGNVSPSMVGDQLRLYAQTKVISVTAVAELWLTLLSKHRTADTGLLASPLAILDPIPALTSPLGPKVISLY